MPAMVAGGLAALNGLLLHRAFAFCLNMVCNVAMNANETSKIIKAAGGDSAFARLIGIDKTPGFQQRVNNWKRRGMPPAVVLEHLRKIERLRRAVANQVAA